MTNKDETKDLQYFQDEVAKEFGYPEYRKMWLNSTSISELAAERYASYKEQQAKHAGFIEGGKIERNRIRKILTSHYGGSSMDSQTVFQILHEKAPYNKSPYELRVKGGEGS